MRRANVDDDHQLCAPLCRLGRSFRGLTSSERKGIGQLGPELALECGRHFGAALFVAPNDWPA